MRRGILTILMLPAAAGLALSAMGQDAVSRTKTSSSTTTARPARQSYLAEFNITRVQTLADGNTVTNESNEVQARDSQGRGYLMTTAPESAQQRASKSVSINDPVAGTTTYWTEPGQNVNIVNFPGSSAARTACAASTLPRMTDGFENRNKPVSEDLGKQTIQEVEAHGRRITRTFPEGAIGNSAPLVRTEEHWNATSPGLDGMIVRQVIDDPRTGKMTKELVKFTPGEPDTTTFQPPQDYQIVTQETHSEVRCP